MINIETLNESSDKETLLRKYIRKIYLSPSEVRKYHRLFVNTQYDAYMKLSDIIYDYHSYRILDSELDDILLDVKKEFKLSDKVFELLVVTADGYYYQ